MAKSTAISDRVSEQLLQICSRNSARAAIPLILAIFLTGFLLHNKVDPLLLRIWLIASCASILLRVILLRVFCCKTGLSGLQKRMVASALTFLVGSTIASVLYFFPLVGTFERAMLTAILLGLCTASHSTNFGYRPLLLSYIGPIMGTLSLMWILNPDQFIHPLFAVAVGVSVLIVGQTLLMNGRFMFDMFALSIESSMKLEEQSRHLADALYAAEQAQNEAETSSQSKSRFIAAASHDLRQPVHVLNLFGAALEKAPLDKNSRDIVSNMTIAVNSLSSQLNALLDISELDSGSVKPSINSVDLQLLVNSLAIEMDKLAEDKGIDLFCHIPENTFVRTDPAMLSQIIRNLCGNSIKYTHQGHVRISARDHDCRPDDIVLSIADTGIGIGESDKDKVFEEFFQISNPGRDKGRGMGLGLSIVERLVRTLGHTLELDSQIGVGTTVSITLKRCTLEQMSAARPPLPAEPSTIELPAGFWVHLLDDEEAVQKSVAAYLRATGCAMSITSSSSETIQFLKTHHPSAILIDLRLQDKDSGLHVVDWIMSHRPELPMAVVTGESLSDGKLAQRYPDLLMLQKPVSHAALLELLDYMASSALENLQTEDAQAAEYQS